METVKRAGWRKSSLMLLITILPVMASAQYTITGATPVGYCGAGCTFSYTMNGGTPAGGLPLGPIQPKAFVLSFSGLPTSITFQFTGTVNGTFVETLNQKQPGVLFNAGTFSYKFTPIQADMPGIKNIKAAYCPGDIIILTTTGYYNGLAKDYIFESYYNTTKMETYTWNASTGTPTWNYTVPGFNPATPQRTFKVRIKGVATPGVDLNPWTGPDSYLSPPVFFYHSAPTLTGTAFWPTCGNGPDGGLVFSINGYQGSGLTSNDTVNGGTKSHTLTNYTLSIQNAIAHNIPFASTITGDHFINNTTYTIDGFNTANTNRLSEPLLPGNYTYQVKNYYTGLANKCYTTGTFNVPAPYLAFNASGTAVTKSSTAYHATCSPGNDGAITLGGGYTNQRTGRNGTVAYFSVTGTSFSSGQLSASPATGLAGNGSTYRVYAIDTYGCLSASSSAITLNSPPALSLGKQVPTPYNLKEISCFGYSDGLIILSQSSGSGRGAYAYSITGLTNRGVPVTRPLQAGLTFTGFAAGTYTAYGMDGFGCFGTWPGILVNEPLPVSITGIMRPVDFGATPPTGQNSYNGFDVSCHNAADGYLQVNATGGAGTLVYGKSPASLTTLNRFTNLSLGGYAFYVQDANLCTTSAGFTLNNNPPVLSVTGIERALYNGFHISCHSTTTGTINDGRVTISGTGGVWANEYDFSIDGSFTYRSIGHARTFTGLYAGAHSFYFQDDNLCVLTGNFSLDQPDPLHLPGYDPHAATCKGYTDGYVAMRATGGVPQWYSYSLTGQNYDGSGTLAYAPQPNRPYTAPVTFTGIKKDHYDIHLTDANACSLDTTFIVSEPEMLSISGLSGIIPCKGETIGYIIANVAGGTTPYAYIWTNGPLITLATTLSGTATITGLSANTRYTLHLTDANRCSNSGSSVPYLTASAFLSEPPNHIRFKQTEVYAPLCYGHQNGSFKVRATGGWDGFEYSSDGLTFSGFNDFGNLSTGNYRYYARDYRGCIRDTTFNLPQPQPLNLTNTYTDVHCFNQRDGRAIFKAVGGTRPYLYHLALNPEQTARHQALAGALSAVTFSGLDTGTYYPLLTDRNNCSLPGTALTLIQPDALQLALQKSDATCGETNGSVSSSLAGGTSPYAYQWRNGGFGSTLPGLNTLYSGNYALKVTDSQDCTVAGTAVIIDRDGPMALASLLRAASCYGKQDGAASITVTHVHGTKTISGYEWVSQVQDLTGFTASITGLAPRQTVTGIAIDSDGCRGGASIYIPSPDPLQISLKGTDPACYRFTDGTIEASVGGGAAPYAYQWDDSLRQSLAKVTHLMAFKGTVNQKTYTLLVKDAHGCEGKDSLVLTNPEEITVKLKKDSAVVCVGQEVVLDAQNPALTHAWTSDKGFSSASRVVSISGAGAYKVVVSDLKGCRAEAGFKLYTSTALLAASFASVDTIYASDTVRLAEISWPAPDSVSWNVPVGIRVLNNAELNLEHTEKEYLYLVGDSAGTYNLSLYARLGECADNIEKKMVVLPFSEKVDNGGRWGFQGIKSYKAFPNPATAVLNLEIELTRASELEVSLLGHLTMEPLFRKQVNSMASHQMEIEMSSYAPGLYVLVLTTPGNRKVLKVMKQ